MKTRYKISALGVLVVVAGTMRLEVENPDAPQGVHPIRPLYGGYGR